MDSINEQKPYPPHHIPRTETLVTKLLVSPCVLASLATEHVIHNENVDQAEVENHVMSFDPRDWTKMFRQTFHQRGLLYFPRKTLNSLRQKNRSLKRKNDTNIRAGIVLKKSCFNQRGKGPFLQHPNTALSTSSSLVTASCQIVSMASLPQQAILQ